MNPRLLIHLTLLFSLLTASAHASDAEILRVREARAALPALTAYLDLLDHAGQPAQGIDLKQLTATVGPHPATVETLQPLAQTNEGIAYLLLVDVSQSLKPAQFARVQTALLDWINALTDRDRAALMTFGDTVRLVQDFTADRAALQAHVARLSASDRTTRLYEGLTRALELARRPDPNLPGLRVIVTLSDGEDDATASLTAPEVLNQLREDRLPIYALGFVAPPLTLAQRDALKTLGGIARAAGGDYLETRDDSLAATYQALRQRIGQGFVARLNCPACAADGRSYRMQLNLTSGQRILSDGLDLRLLPNPAPPPESPKSAPPPAPEPVAPPKPEPVPEPTLLGLSLLWIYAISGAVLALLIGGLLFSRRRKLSKVVTAPPEPIPAPEPVPFTPTVVATPGQTVQILVVRGPRDAPRDYTLTLRDRAVLGRGPQGCDLIIEGDPEISILHCLLIRQNGQLVLRDLNSTNGTLVNGVPIHGERRLHDGDTVLLGNTELRLLPGPAP
jgi:hypothetical protein